MLTRLLETAANAADAAQSGSNGTDLTQLTHDSFRRAALSLSLIHI